MILVVKVSLLAFDTHNVYEFVGVHTIAAVKVKEDYDGIAEGYADCFEAINDVISNPHVTINGVDYNLKFFLCCDYKVSTGLIVLHYLEPFLQIRFLNTIFNTILTPYNNCN